METGPRLRTVMAVGSDSHSVPTRDKKPTSCFWRKRLSVLIFYAGRTWHDSSQSEVAGANWPHQQACSKGFSKKLTPWNTEACRLSVGSNLSDIVLLAKMSMSVSFASLWMKVLRAGKPSLWRCFLGAWISVASDGCRTLLPAASQAP